LRAGIPTIIKPFFGDQFFWADRVEALDVGSGVRKLTVDNLAEALRTATTDVKQIEKAKLLGQKIRAENGVDKAVEAIYRDLEYARSLIKQPSTPGQDDGDLGPRKVDETPDRSESAKSDWSMLSGSEGDGVERPPPVGINRGGSPTPIHGASKRASITGALSALSSAMPKTSIMRKVSADAVTR